MNTFRFGSLFVSALCGAMILAQTCLADCPTHAGPGDVTCNGKIDVADVQCAVLIALSDLDISGEPQSILACTTFTVLADLDCSQTVEVTDILLIVSHALDGVPHPELDADANGIVDSCQECMPIDQCIEDGAVCPPAGTVQYCGPCTGDHYYRECLVFTGELGGDGACETTSAPLCCLVTSQEEDCSCMGMESSCFTGVQYLPEMDVCWPTSVHEFCMNGCTDVSGCNTHDDAYFSVFSWPGCTFTVQTYVDGEWRGITAFGWLSSTGVMIPRTIMCAAEKVVVYPLNTFCPVTMTNPDGGIVSWTVEMTETESSGFLVPLQVMKGPGIPPHPSWANYCE